MGWFWGSSDSNKAPSGSDDPLRNLDPSLRDFLAKESPVKYNSSNPPAATKPSPEPAAAPAASATTPVSTNTAETDESKVPAQSLYQDGRYAHLWKTYQSQTEAEAAVKSDQEKIDDVLEGYKYRKAEIGRAALENCALEQWEVNECFRNGAWADRVTLCRKQNRELERCYMMQAKFLKALGYLSTFNQPDVDEKIQMHADKLYHRMLDQEAAAEAAKEAGKVAPSFPPLLSTPISASTKAADTKKQVPSPSTPDSNIPHPTAPDVKPSELSPAVQAQLKKRLEGLEDKERLVEEQAIAAEIRAGEEVAGQLGKIYAKQEEERKIRREQGRETMGDRLSSIFSGR